MQTIFKYIGPAGFTGATFGDWVRVLRRVGFSIDVRYWPRAAAITFSSVPNTVARRAESLFYQRAVERTKIERPLFVLGVWRGGTTYLHNLLAIDERFSFPNFYQTMNPHTFLLTERTNARLFNLFIPKKRPQDNVRMSMQEPQEDEFALCPTGQSLLLSLAFPRCRDDFDRYLTLRRLTDDERRRWAADFLWFVKKVAYRRKKPLILKSPGHTARIRLLLELFPDARFVHIRRNPYDVFRSSCHTVRKLAPWWGLQRHDFHDLEQRAIEQYKELYDAYFEEQPLIPKNQFCEVSFEALEKNPINQVRKIYESLELPEFADVEPQRNTYIQSLKGYRKNEFEAIPVQWKHKIREQWAVFFERWGYSL